MKRTRALIGAAAAALTLGMLAGPALATEEPPPEIIKGDCDQGNVDCGDWPSEVPEGSECTVTVDGETYEGETNEAGVCVCPGDETPPSTTPPSTEPPAPSTTVVSPSTTVTPPTLLPSDTTPSTTASDANFYTDCEEAIADGRAPLHEGDVGFRPELDGDGDGVACEIETEPTGSVEELPRTGSSVTSILSFLGAGLVFLGAAALSFRKRIFG